MWKSTCYELPLNSYLSHNGILVSTSHSKQCYSTQSHLKPKFKVLGRSRNKLELRLPWTCYKYTYRYRYTGINIYIYISPRKHAQLTQKIYQQNVKLWHRIKAISILFQYKKSIKFIYYATRDLKFAVRRTLPRAAWTKKVKRQSAWKTQRNTRE